MDSASLHHIRCQSAYHRNDYKYYFYEIHISVSTSLGNRFSVKRKKLAGLQILFFASKGQTPDCITILMMFVLTEKKCGLLCYFSPYHQTFLSELFIIYA